MSGINEGSGPCFVYIGTYTNGGSGGIHTFRFDASSGKLMEAQPVMPAPSPSYLVASQDKRTLYAVLETDTNGGNPGGAVASYAIDCRSGALTELNRRPTQGRSPCHLCVDEGNSTLFAANYVDGTVTVFPLNTDAGIAPASGILRHTGSGPDRERQEGPHAHFVTLTPDGQFLCAVDLGIDRVMVNPINREDGRPRPDACAAVVMRPGSGPRHMAFHQNGRFAYVITELSNEIAAFEYLPGEGVFQELQYVTTLPEGFIGVSYCAAIHIAPGGRTLYASNRGHDSIAAFRIDESTGRLSPISYTPTGGRFPRDFSVAPLGRFLFAANQDSDTIVAFAIDKDSGALRPMGQVVRVPKPVCVKFVEMGSVKV